MGVYLHPRTGMDVNSQLELYIGAKAFIGICMYIPHIGIDLHSLMHCKHACMVEIVVSFWFNESSGIYLGRPRRQPTAGHRACPPACMLSVHLNI